MTVKGGVPAALHAVTLALDEAVPAAVEVGAELAFAVRAVCAHGCNLGGQPVQLTASGEPLARGELAQCGGDGVAGELRVDAPRDVGEQSWTISLPRHEHESVIHEECRLPLRFRTVPHACSLTAWGVPSPVAAGSSMQVKVGVRCASGCGLAGARVAVLDAAGTAVGAGVLGDEPWTGTGALFWTRVSARAPAVEGVHAWTAELRAVPTELAHEGAPAPVGFRTGPACEHRAAVRVITAADGVPVAGVEVRVGPYAATTGADGMAAVAVPPGAFEVSIRKDGLDAPPQQIAVEGDLELDIEAQVVPTRAELHEQAMRDYPWG